MRSELTGSVTSNELALLEEAPPDGPVGLWVAVMTADGDMMGAGRLTEPVRWRWHEGHLCACLGDVPVVVQWPGTYHHGRLIAVDPGTGAFSLLTPLTLPAVGYRLRAGGTITVQDVKITCDFRPE